LFFYRDPNEKNPLASIDLNKNVMLCRDAQPEVLIPNSFKLEGVTGSNTPYFLFADDQDSKEIALAGIAKCCG